MNTFGKKSGCPSSERVLAHARRLLSPSLTRRVNQHVVSCDFCAAEMLFLTKYAPSGDSYASTSGIEQNSLYQKVLLTSTVYERPGSRAA